MLPETIRQKNTNIRITGHMKQVQWLFTFPQQLSHTKHYYANRDYCLPWIFSLWIGVLYIRSRKVQPLPLTPHIQLSVTSTNPLLRNCWTTKTNKFLFVKAKTVKRIISVCGQVYKTTIKKLSSVMDRLRLKATELLLVIIADYKTVPLFVFNYF